MHSLDHEITIGASPAAVSAALTTSAGLRGWFSSGVSGSGEAGTSWEITFPGSVTRFTWEVEAVRPEVVVAWRCLDGPGDSIGTTVSFRLEEVAGGPRVHFTHRGWPHTAGAYTKCNTLWGGLLHHLKNYAESGTAAPLYAA